MRRPTINILTYILDDQEDLIEAIDIFFKEKGLTNYHLFTSPDHFLDKLNSDVAICIIDYRLANPKSGADIIKEVKEKNPLCYFIVMSAELSIQTAVECVNNGANKILLKTDKDFMPKLVEYLKEAIEMVTERFETYSKIWENFLETDKLFEKLKQTKNESRELDITDKLP